MTSCVRTAVSAARTGGGHLLSPSLTPRLPLPLGLHRLTTLGAAPQSGRGLWGLQNRPPDPGSGFAQQRWALTLGGSAHHHCRRHHRT